MIPIRLLCFPDVLICHIFLNIDAIKVQSICCRLADDIIISSKGITTEYVNHRLGLYVYVLLATSTLLVESELALHALDPGGGIQPQLVGCPRSTFRHALHDLINLDKPKTSTKVLFSSKSSSYTRDQDKQQYVFAPEHIRVCLVGCITSSNLSK